MTSIKTDSLKGVSDITKTNDSYVNKFTSLVDTDAITRSLQLSDSIFTGDFKERFSRISELGNT